MHTPDEVIGLEEGMCSNNLAIRVKSGQFSLSSSSCFIGLEHVGSVSRGKEYILSQCYKKRDQKVRWRMSVFLKAITDENREIGCYISPTKCNNGIFFATMKYFTLGIKYVMENTVHKYVMKSPNVPLYVYRTVTDFIMNPDIMVLNTLPTSEFLIENNFQLQIVTDEIAIPSGSFYFFVSPTHCAFSLFVQKKVGEQVDELISAVIDDETNGLAEETVQACKKSDGLANETVDLQACKKSDGLADETVQACEKSDGLMDETVDLQAPCEKLDGQVDEQCENRLEVYEQMNETVDLQEYKKTDGQCDETMDGEEFDELICELCDDKIDDPVDEPVSDVFPIIDFYTDFPSLDNVVSMLDDIDKDARITQLECKLNTIKEKLKALYESL